MAARGVLARLGLFSRREALSAGVVFLLVFRGIAIGIVGSPPQADKGLIKSRLKRSPERTLRG